MNILAKSFLIFSCIFFMYCFATDPVVRAGGDMSDPLDFHPDVCKCSNLVDEQETVVGGACMCESTVDWPGKVLVLYLTTKGASTIKGFKELHIELE